MVLTLADRLDDRQERLNQAGEGARWTEMCGSAQPPARRKLRHCAGQVSDNHPWECSALADRSLDEL